MKYFTSYNSNLIVITIINIEQHNFITTNIKNKILYNILEKI